MELRAVDPHAKSAVEFVGDLVRDVHLGDGKHVAITCSRPDYEQLVTVSPADRIASTVARMAFALIRNRRTPRRVIEEAPRRQM